MLTSRIRKICPQDFNKGGF
ncbi:hypothetical protein Zm00014a_033473 [Zea mays]|uniref:Uncharacterized protein n=1 Tax=Zea mays TaxID=4577 RepID=A0A3L6EC61_MAIZE|nr:hypothetical protein Zm00014a_033473 [Zea mays]